MWVLVEETARGPTWYASGGNFTAEVGVSDRAGSSVSLGCQKRRKAAIALCSLKS